MGPKKKTRFTHTKRGKYHQDLGGRGRGFRGRPPVHSINQPMPGQAAEEIVSLQKPVTEPQLVDILTDPGEAASVSTDERQEPALEFSVPGLSSLEHHNYAQSPVDLPLGGNTEIHTEGGDSTYGPPDTELIQDAVEFLKAPLPAGWIPIADNSGVHVLLICRAKEKAIQRRIYVAFSGEVEITIHRKQLPKDMATDLEEKSGPKVALTRNDLCPFVEKILSLVTEVRKFEICVGVTKSSYEPLWSSESSGYVDENPYGEVRYVTTFRSHKCCLLVPPKQWRCGPCSVSSDNLRKKSVTHATNDFKPHTSNIYLTEEQKLQKLKRLHADIRNKMKVINRLKEKVQKYIQKQGVTVGQDLSDDFNTILKENDSKLSDLQRLFVQQQLMFASKNKKSGMRWHPTMIRFALLLKTTSSAAYNAIQSSGVISLPSERTLFEYSRFLAPQEDCSADNIERIYKKLQEFPEDYQKYHVLIMDEVHVSQKLVYQKSTGEMIGYVKLDEVTEEIVALQKSFDKKETDVSPPLAKQMLTYMVKGTANSIKEVVASFATAHLTKEDLYCKTWRVINILERAGIRIIAVVSDGASVNRGFIQMNTPVTRTESGVVFDTLNMQDPDRPIFFFADVPHLLKTIRNAFAKSGTSKGSTRLLTKNGETIEWKTILKLFLGDQSKNWRRCHKLTTQNVYLTSYSCMKVSYAAQVMSRTVALDLKERNWPGTSETVKFIENVNDFFDRLNGAHTSMALKTANDNLAAYTSVNDERFQKLLDFLEYLKEWEREADAKENFTKAMRDKMLLSRQTREGIEMSIRAFIGATKFLLSQGTRFINARIFCQDPLEQFFSKQRASFGGSSNPNVHQFLANQVRIGVHRDVNVRRKSANIRASETHMEVSEEKLPKRKRES